MTGKRWFTGLIGIGMLAVIVAGCEEAERDAITSVEADAVAKVITDATLGAWGNSTGSLPPDGGTALMALEEYDYEVPCPEGGSIHLKGTIDTSDDGSSSKMEGTMTFKNCAKMTEDGETIVLTEGTIDDMLHARVGGDGSTVTLGLDGSWNGSVSWENEDDGSSGVCDIDVTLEATIEIDMVTGEHDVDGGLSGTVCGVSVDDDDWSVEMG